MQVSCYYPLDIFTVELLLTKKVACRNVYHCVHNTHCMLKKWKNSRLVAHHGLCCFPQTIVLVWMFARNYCWGRGSSMHFCLSQFSLQAVRQKGVEWSSRCTLKSNWLNTTLVTVGLFTVRMDFIYSCLALWEMVTQFSTDPELSCVRLTLNLCLIQVQFMDINLFLCRTRIHHV